MENKLIFGKGNSKLNKNKRYTFANFDLPAGYSCPMADKCLAFADNESGKITDGKNSEFRCYAASLESVFSSVRKKVWNNFDIVKPLANKLGYKKLIEILHDQLPPCHYFRIHTHGDFFNYYYFKSWIEVAKKNPHIIFYFYTKRVDYILDYADEFPENFKYTISIGGKLDHLIEPWMKTAQVIYSEEEAKNLNLEIDTDDSHAYNSEKSFCFLIHGTQAKGSYAGKAWQKIKTEKRKQSINN